MEAIDRRSALLSILCVTAAASFAASLPAMVEAMPLAPQKDLGGQVQDLEEKPQPIARRPSERPMRGAPC